MNSLYLLIITRLQPAVTTISFLERQEYQRYRRRLVVSRTSQGTCTILVTLLPSFYCDDN
ncbi:hypothetical protein SERLA73DRAFT_176619 [Serpula lacrymans var. lacrymans S7.3]|uniref:Uncharacterized protein n=2 Tax=Serpula lacrymans var. lacrymans TaxID=341189 RepID=F8PNB9_SERL3|nr:uncharacterized protein SERLADRAFT_459709 [Serpula lacrymans var. lacrymans S7.9]EGO03101.1 hypothetical protein SERLA73DRAFT_176619 [Serpula lacrymans var. lacrymans S7.3]EGO28863.1 hypothetical protein SERLADRAFT_459709 [Serpula lacrymans var. lacrymans S7.9]